VHCWFQHEISDRGASMKVQSILVNTLYWITVTVRANTSVNARTHPGLPGMG
jgi:hypothetical protein